MFLTNFLKQNKDCNTFLKSLKRIISKGSNKKGILFIGVNPKDGKIIIYKGMILSNTDFLGSIVSKDYYQVIIDIMNSLNIKPAEESSIPEFFISKENYIFYILNDYNQERLQL